MELTLGHSFTLWGRSVIIPHQLQRHMRGELHDCHLGMMWMKPYPDSHLWWPDLDKKFMTQLGCVLSVVRPKTYQSRLHLFLGIGPLNHGDMYIS